MAIEHASIPDGQRHEPKGASTALNGQVLRANGSGGTSWQTLNNYMGWWNYDDATTSGTPIPLTTAGTYYTLTNDTAGAQTLIFAGLSGVTPWNSSTNRFDFSGLELGDTVDIRLDVVATTAGANHNIIVDLELGTGSGTPIIIPFINNTVNTAGTAQLIRYNSIFIGSSLVKDNPARFVAKSDSTGDTIEVNGWYVRVIKRSI